MRGRHLFFHALRLPRYEDGFDRGESVERILVSSVLLGCITARGVVTSGRTSSTDADVEDVTARLVNESMCVFCGKDAKVQCLARSNSIN